MRFIAVVLFVALTPLTVWTSEGKLLSCSIEGGHEISMDRSKKALLTIKSGRGAHRCPLKVGYIGHEKPYGISILDIEFLLVSKEQCQPQLTGATYKTLNKSIHFSIFEEDGDGVGSVFLFKRPMRTLVLCESLKYTIPLPSFDISKI